MKKKIKVEIEMFTDEMLQNVFMFQPSMSSRQSSSGKPIRKSISLKSSRKSIRSNS